MNDLIVHPHPLTTQGRVVLRAAAVYPRESLAQFLERNGVELADGRWMVTIGGALVPAAMLACTRPKAGQLILCRRVPGKEALAAIAIIALVAFTYGAAAWALPALSGLAAGSFGLIALQTGVMMVGSLLINKVLAPSRARLPSYDQQTGSTYSLQGGRNRLRPYEPMGLLLGVTKVVPDFLAQPFTWFASDEQYQAVRLHAGINCGSVDELKIGVTPLASFTDVVESRVGFPAGNLTLPFWSDVDTQTGALLDAPTSPGAWVTRTSSLYAVLLVVDVAAQLYSMDGSGALATQTLDIEIERRLLPSGAWEPFSGAVSVKTLTSKATKPVRMSFSSTTLPAGQYEVRVRKATANVSTTTASNQVEWAALKTYQEDPTLGQQNPQVALSIKASGQLSGVLDQVSWVASQLAVPVWSGAAWVSEVTRNPGAHILLLARGIFDGGGRLLAGLGLPDSQIDIDGLKTFMLHCAAEGYVFDHWFDAQLSCIEVLEAIAAAGLGSISFDTGRLGVAWLAEDQPLEAVVTMGNMKQGSFRVDHTTSASADELEVSWFDRDADWANRSLRILAPGVTVPRQTARLAPIGASTEAAAVRAARLAMAQNIYQRKSVSWEMDLEHMAFRRYSLIALAHDVTRWGYSGRVRAASIAAGDIVTLELDDAVPFNPGATMRSIGLRIPGEAGYRVFDISVFAGESSVITLVDPWPAGVAVPGDSSLNAAHDTLWIYDFAATPGRRLRVTEIEPSPDLKGARITAVPEPDEFWAYMASGAYTAPPSPASGPALVVSNISVTQRRLDVNYGEGTELSITFDAVGPFSNAQVWGGSVGESLTMLGTTVVTRFGPWPVGRGGSYEIVVRPFDALGRQGAFASHTHVVTLGDTQLAWGGVVGRPRLFRVVAKGFADVRAPTSPTLWDAETGSNLVGAYDRSYMFARLSRATGAVQWFKQYDVFGSGVVGGFGAADLVADLNVCDASHVVVVWTYDEPQQNRLTAGLEAAMYRCGASRAVFGSPQFKARSAYVLVSIGGCGEGNGFEAYNGQIDSDTNAWCDVSFYLQNGQLVVSGMAATPRSLRDYSYTGTLDATTELALEATGLVVLAGNMARKLVATNTWGDAQVYSRDGFTGGAFASVVAMDVTGAVFFGLAADPSADAGFASIDFAAYLWAGGLRVYESGSLQGVFGAYSVGDVVAVAFDGYSVRYSKNGTVFYTSAAHPAPTTKLFFDSSFYDIVGIKNLRFGPQSAVASIDTAQLNSESATTVVTVTAAGPIAMPASVPVPDNQQTVLSVPVGPYSFAVRIRASATFKCRVWAPASEPNSLSARICNLNAQTVSVPPMQAFGLVDAASSAVDNSNSINWEGPLAAGATAVVALGGVNGKLVSPYGSSEMRDALMTVEVIKR